MRASRFGIVLMLSVGRRPVHAAHRGAAILAARAPDSRTAAAATENLFRAVLVGSPRCGRRTTRRRYPRSLWTKAARASRAPRHPRGVGPRAHAHDLRIRILKHARPGASTEPHLWRAHKTSSGADRDRSQSLHNRHTVRSGVPAFLLFFSCVRFQTIIILFYPLGFRCELKIDYNIYAIYIR